MVQRNRIAHVRRVGIVPPHTAVKEIKPCAAHRARDDRAAFVVLNLLLVVLPALPVVGPNPHRIDQPNRAAERAHVLAHVTAGEKHVRTSGRSDQFQPVAIYFDVSFPRIVERGIVADIIVAVAVVHINLLGGRAGPQTVHLEIVDAPAVDGFDQLGQVLLHLRQRQIERRAAPRRVIGFAVITLHEPMLPVLVFRILKIAGKRHEPKARGQPHFLQRIGHRLHAVSEGTVRPNAIKTTPRTVELHAILPLVVDLNK